MLSKEKFEGALRELADVLTCYVSTEDGQWTIKGFIDVFRNVYTISNVNTEIAIHTIDALHSITSVISSIQFFVAEKWRIAGDRGGSGNTANIGSIQRIEDILSGNGMFAKLGEEWFDDYWMNYDKISFKTESGKTKTIKSLEDFVKFRGGDTSLIIRRNNKR